MTDIIVAVVLFLIAVAAFVMSIRSFLEKGFLFNNAYIYASAEEREKMNKTPYYRQSGVVFLLIGVVFTLNGLATLLRTDALFSAAVAVMVAAAVFAVASAARIRKDGE